MSEYLDIVEEEGDYRVRLEYDDSPDKPYNDGATPILTFESGGYNGYSIAAFNTQAEPYVEAAERLNWRGMEVFERYLKVFHGTVKLQEWYSDGLRGYYVAFDTAAWREKVGAPIDRLEKEDYLSEVRAWAEGEVYGHIVEKKVKAVTSYPEDDDLEDEEDVEWLETEDGACWGFYGRDWAEEAAREALKWAVEHDAKVQK